MPQNTTPQVNQPAQKTYQQVVGLVTLSGLWQLLEWLLGNSTFVLETSNQPKEKCLGVIHQDGNPNENTYIVIDVRVLGRTILLGYVQILYNAPSPLPIDFDHPP